MADGVGHERQGTAYDPDAIGYELQGRECPRRLTQIEWLRAECERHGYIAAWLDDDLIFKREDGSEVSGVIA